MAGKKTPTVKHYEITVEKCPHFCGVGAGGVHFANGKATTESARMAAWFKEHRGYKVTEVTEATEDTDKSSSED